MASPGNQWRIQLVSRHPPFCLGAFLKRTYFENMSLWTRFLAEQGASWTRSRNYRNLVKGFDRCRTTAWRQRFLLRPKNCLVPVTWVEIIGGGVPLSDGLDTRSCKILDPRLKEPALCQLYRRTFVAYDVTRHTSNGPLCCVHIRRTSLTSVKPEV